MSKQTVTQERLKELLDYNPETGDFTWRKTTGGRLGGTVAGAIAKNAGYTQIRVDRRKYFAHRLAFLWMTGEWPEDMVDHINRNRADNRWCNLREANRSLNNLNNGAKGYCWIAKDKKFMAKVSGRYIGSFDTEHEARQAYLAAKRERMMEAAA